MTRVQMATTVKAAYALVWEGVVWYGRVWFGMGGCGLVWEGLVWEGVVWSTVCFKSLLLFIWSPACNPACKTCGGGSTSQCGECASGYVLDDAGVCGGEPQE